MWQTIRRLILPTAILLLGVGMWVYGARQHTQPVIEEQEMTFLEPDPNAPPFDPFGDPFPGAPPFDGPPEFGPPGEFVPPPPPPMIPVTVLADVVERNAEPLLIRDVTIGGLVLSDSGELRRTYTGEPPSLCPT